MKITQLSAYDDIQPKNAEPSSITVQLSMNFTRGEAFEPQDGANISDAVSKALEGFLGSNIAIERPTPTAGASDAKPGRRSRAASSAEPASTTTTTEAAENPTPRGRRRGSAAPAETAETKTAPSEAASSPSDAPAPRRRRAAAEPSEPTIADAELLKAASEAASVLGPDNVTVALTEFGVAQVQELKGYDLRKEFIDYLGTWVAEAKAA